MHKYPGPGVLGWGRKYPGYVQGPFCSVAPGGGKSRTRTRKDSSTFGGLFGLTVVSFGRGGGVALGLSARLQASRRPLDSSDPPERPSSTALPPARVGPTPRGPCRGLLPTLSQASRQAARGRKLRQWFDLALRTSTPVPCLDAAAA